MSEEIWKTIPDFDNYLISNLGRVKSFQKEKNGKIMINCINTDGYYAVLLINKEKKLSKNIHRLLAELFILNPNNLPCVDHVNNDRLNNDLNNLCWCTHGQNQFNTNKKSTKTSSQYKGVYWNKRSQKWHAQVSFERKKYHLGYFTSEIEAALAYNTAAQKFFKTFAKLNEIDES